MKKLNLLKNNNGFTIVELVIVIAVIAILAAVLVPTFSNVVEKGNVINDKSLVRNINNVLEINSSTDNTINDKTQLRILLNDYGINNTKNKSDNDIIFWSKSYNMCFIWGIKEQQIIFPEYIRNKTLDDFTDEIDISSNEVTNQVVNAKKKGNDYCDGYRNDARLSNTNADIEKNVADYVATGIIPIDTTQYDSLTIYIKGGELNGNSFSAMHFLLDGKLYKYTNLKEEIVCEMDGDKGQLNVKIEKISEGYYKLILTNYDTIKEAINDKTIYFAVSLYGEGKNLIITFNEEIMTIN